MEFHQRRKPTPSVPILPLIDILTILLIFFVVTTQFKKKKHTLDVQLPMSNGSPITLTISDTAILAITKEGQYSLNEVQVGSDELLKFLSFYKEDNPTAKFIIEQDKLTPEEYEVFAADMIHTAGFSDVSKRVLLEGEEQ